MSLQTGQIVDGKYRIIREIGSGAMGAVYEGENVRIKRRVAIKVLLPEVADRGDVVQRFEREAQAAGRIGSDHIVEVLDLGSLTDGGFYMVMEFLEGETLGARIKQRGRLDGRAIAPITQQLLMGLEMAHEAKIIHRDLKPENVFLCRDHAGQRDFVKILDFGVSKFNPLNDDDAMSMTRTGTVVGTPFYMAPEQAKGSRDIDNRSDLYSVGVIMYEAVTGQVPFHAGTFNELIFKIVLETPPPPEKFAPDMDPGFAGIVRKSMCREPSDRYQTAAEFRDALYVWLHTGRDTAKPHEVRSPPVGSDIDWIAEKKTLLLDGDDPSNMATRVMADGLGGGTALMAPENATTRVMDPDTDSNAKTVDKPSTPPLSKQAPLSKHALHSKRPPPAPRSKRALTRPLGSAGDLAQASGASARLVPRSTPPAPAPVRLAAPPIPQQMGGGLGIGAPTPVNRRPIPLEDWPTGVPRRRSNTLPLVVGAVLVLGLGGAAAAVVIPTWTSPTTRTEVADVDEEPTALDDEPSEESAKLPPETIAQESSGDTNGEHTETHSTNAPVPAHTSAPAGAPKPAAVPPPPPVTPPPANPPPITAPPRPPPTRPKPAPAPKPKPEAAPPKPSPTKPGRKVETTL